MNVLHRVLGGASAAIHFVAEESSCRHFSIIFWMGFHATVNICACSENQEALRKTGTTHHAVQTVADEPSLQASVANGINAQNSTKTQTNEPEKQPIPAK